MSMKRKYTKTKKYWESRKKLRNIELREKVMALYKAGYSYQQISLFKGINTSISNISRIVNSEEKIEKALKNAK